MPGEVLCYIHQGIIQKLEAQPAVMRLCPGGEVVIRFPVLALA
jgi:hypothetical protein